MYLKKTPTKTGRISLSAVQGYRDNGRVRQRTVETFGYVDELAQHYADPIAHFTEVVAQMDAERRDAEKPQVITLHPSRRIDKNAANRKTYGDAVPLAYYHALGIEAAVRSGVRGRGCRFDVNSLLRLLVAERLLAPEAQEAAWDRAPYHFYRTELSESDAFRGLSELARIADDVVCAMNSALSAVGLIDAATVKKERIATVFGTGDDEVEATIELMQDAIGIPIGYRLHIPGTLNPFEAGLIPDSATSKRATVRVERAFEMTKPHLRNRAIYAWSIDHIRAHALVCYVALSIIRIMQSSLQSSLGDRCTCESIIADLRKQYSSHVEGEWWLNSHCSEMTDALYALIGEESPGQWMTGAQFHALFAKGKPVRWGPTPASR